MLTVTELLPINLISSEKLKYYTTFFSLFSNFSLAGLLRSVFIHSLQSVNFSGKATLLRDCWMSFGKHGELFLNTT